MSAKLPPFREALAIEWPAFSYHIPCMVYIIQLLFSAFLSILKVNDHTKTWDGNKHYKQFEENEGTDLGKRQRHRNKGNARVDKVSAMRSGLGKIIEKVHTLRNFGSPETDHRIATNVCGIVYVDTWSLKRVH